MPYAKFYILLLSFIYLLDGSNVSCKVCTYLLVGSDDELHSLHPSLQLLLLFLICFFNVETSSDMSLPKSGI